jgi:hypothetical protein
VKSIFFDLETSDKNPIGQILNYCFIFVDDDFLILAELSGLIQISRLQLPAPEAILANRIDVIEHQQQAHDSERIAMAKIHDFIVHCIELQGNNGKLPIIGYNSARFDIPYLRTSLIRNGINPYFNGRIVIRDLLFVSRKLAATDPRFPRAISLNSAKDQSRVSYSLENLGHQFGILTGEQSHESRADVLLTIDLAKQYLEKFSVDVRSFDPFEALLDQERPVRGLIRWSRQLDYNPDSEQAASTRAMVLLDFDHRSSLWIDLSRFKEKADRSAVYWFSHNGGHQFIAAPSEPLTPDERELMNRALELFKDLTLKNFFEKSSCDIEQDIYRLDFAAIDSLTKAIFSGEEQKIKTSKNRDLQVIFLRYQLASIACNQPLPAQFEKPLRAYSEYRYGGKALLSKQVPDETWDDKRKGEAYHPRIEDYLATIERLNATMTEPSSKMLLQSLEKFYHQSDVLRLLNGSEQVHASS